MVEVEKLSIFNIEIFRELYDGKDNSYICDKTFFEAYDNEPFIVKFILRKQVKLFKLNEKYIGYIWHEYPISKNSSCNIYSLYIKDEYIDCINHEFLDALNIYSFKIDIRDNSKNLELIKKLNFKLISETLLMRLDACNTMININKNLIFEHFKKNKHENLRCELQNLIFDNKDRIPLSVSDILAEEEEKYYLDDFSVFIAIDSCTPIGYGQVILNKSKYTIVNLGIIKEHRGMGYGEELLKYLINLCVYRNIGEIYIRVDKKNIPALNLYTKLGFREYNSYSVWNS